MKGVKRSFYRELEQKIDNANYDEAVAPERCPNCLSCSLEYNPPMKCCKKCGWTRFLGVEEE